MKMTHYTIDYSNTADQTAKDNAAMADVQAYLSDKQWDYIRETFYCFEGESIGYQAAKKWLQALSFACMMVGIQGYPVRAMKRKFLAQFVRG